MLRFIWGRITSYTVWFVKYYILGGWKKNSHYYQAIEHDESLTEWHELMAKNQEMLMNQLYPMRKDLMRKKA